MKSITATVVETALGEEVTECLGHEKHQVPTAENGNICNGTRPTMVLTDAAGEVTIAVPRDRVGTFGPVIVREAITSLLGGGRRRDQPMSSRV